MISLKNKGLKTQKSSKLCKTHKIRKSQICRNGKIKLNMTKAVAFGNFRYSFRRYSEKNAKKTIAVKKGQ